MTMTPMTFDEIKVHQKNISRIAKRKQVLKEKWFDGLFTKAKYAAKVDELEVEELDYIAKSKVILYFGKYYRGEV